MAIPDTFCPRHPDADLGISKEHVFCLRDGCSWEEELCWDNNRERDQPLTCTRISGHDGEHSTVTEDGIYFTWSKFGAIQQATCSSCGDFIFFGQARCGVCEQRLMQQALVGKDRSYQAQPNCSDCGVEMMGQFGKLCKACKKSPRCERCGRNSRGLKYCAECQEVLRTGSAPSL